jgi:18S rRNA (guanine1575-N7)-methyltransferase
VFQFYPQDADQVNMITQAALRTGFSGGIIVDFPNSTKAKKYFLCLLAGEPNPHEVNPYLKPRGVNSKKSTRVTQDEETKGEEEEEEDDDEEEEEDEDGEEDENMDDQQRLDEEEYEEAQAKKKRRRMQADSDEDADENDDEKQEEEQKSIKYDDKTNVGIGIQRMKRKESKKVAYKSKEWILKKKDRMRRMGKQTANDSKYTGKKRKPRF